MAERHWTVVLVPHGARRSRAVRVPVRVFQITVGVLSVLAVVVASFMYTAVRQTVDLSRLDRMERRNQLLAEELARAQGTIAVLSDTVTALAMRDQQVRLLAGLEPTDPDVLLAGIGGPAAPWTEREQTLSEGPVGREALDLRERLDDLVRRANLLAGTYTQAVDSLRGHTDRLARTPSIHPLDPNVSYWFTSSFSASRMHPIFHVERPHEGIDLSAPMGAPILAPANGRVIEVRTQAGYGKTVTIDHGYGIQTMYAHCSKINVIVGQTVERGMTIAEVGKTGIATGPHLHYEVIQNGKPQNPNTFIFPAKIVD